MTTQNDNPPELYERDWTTVKRIRWSMERDYCIGSTMELYVLSAYRNYANRIRIYNISTDD